MLLTSFIFTWLHTSPALLIQWVILVNHLSVFINLFHLHARVLLSISIPLKWLTNYWIIFIYDFIKLLKNSDFHVPCSLSFALEKKSEHTWASLFLLASFISWSSKIGISLESQQTWNVKLFPHITFSFDHAYWNTILTKNMNDRIFLEIFFSHIWSSNFLESCCWMVYWSSSVCNITPLRSCMCVCECILYTHLCMFSWQKVDMTRNKVYVLWSVFWVFMCHTTLYVQQL